MKVEYPMSKRVAFLGRDTENFFEQLFVDDRWGQTTTVPVEQADYVFNEILWPNTTR